MPVASMAWPIGRRARRSREPGGPSRSRRPRDCTACAPPLSRDSVHSPTWQPRRAAANAASTPACPAPTTMTSNFIDTSRRVISRCRTARRYDAARRRSCARPPLRRGCTRAACRSASTNSSGVAPRCRLARRDQDARAPLEQRDVAHVRDRGGSRSGSPPVSARAIAARSVSIPSPSRRHRDRRRRQRPTPRCVDRSCSRPRVARRRVSLEQSRRRRRSTSQRRRAPRAPGRRPRARVRRARTPSRSTRSIVSRAPAVSTSVTASPRCRRVSVTRSRVVPAVSVTIARSCPSSALKRLDFPTFGRPAITTVAPSRIIRPRAASRAARRAASITSSTAPAIVVRLDEVIALVRKIERRLEPRDQIEQRGIERR